MAKIPCVKETRPDVDDGTSSCIWPIKAFDLEAEMAGAEPGEKILLEYCEMTEAELDFGIRGPISAVDPAHITASVRRCRED